MAIGRRNTKPALSGTPPTANSHRNSVNLWQCKKISRNLGNFIVIFHISAIKHVFGVNPRDVNSKDADYRDLKLAQE